MKTVLLLVDQKARDLASVLLIGEYLKAMGVRTAICNKTNMLSAVLRHRPDVFVMSGTHGNFQAVARHICPWCKLVLMTQEGACVTRDATILRLRQSGLPTEETCRFHSFGWDYTLDRLAVVASGGDPGPSPFPEL